MQVRAIQNANVLRPSRLNAAGCCIYCLGRHCQNARCVSQFAESVWETCTRCGGTEYLNGHVDPETASTRCDCIQGLTEAEFPASVAEVVELDRVRASEPVKTSRLAYGSVGPVMYESWPAGGGAPKRWMA